MMLSKLFLSQRSVLWGRIRLFQRNSYLFWQPLGCHQSCFGGNVFFFVCFFNSYSTGLEKQMVKSSAFREVRQSETGIQIKLQLLDVASSTVVLWSQLYTKYITPEITKIEILLYESHNSSSFIRKTLLFHVFYPGWWKSLWVYCTSQNTFRHLWCSAAKKNKRQAEEALSPIERRGSQTMTSSLSRSSFTSDLVRSVREPAEGRAGYASALSISFFVGKTLRSFIFWI